MPALLLSQMVAYLAQEESFFLAILVLPCQPLGEALIRSHNAHMLPEMREPFYFPLLN